MKNLIGSRQVIFFKKREYKQSHKTDVEFSFEQSIFKIPFTAQ